MIEHNEFSTLWTYDQYKCGVCNHEWTCVHPFGEPPESCHVCHGEFILVWEESEDGD